MYNSYSQIALEAVIDWADSDRGTRAGRRAQVALGIGSLMSGAPLLIEGVCTRNPEHILAGAGVIAAGAGISDNGLHRLKGLKSRVIKRP